MYNKVTLVGRITHDLEIKNSGTEKVFLRFSIACTRSRDNNTTDFFNCVAFGKNAENTAKYCGKGSLILVDGSIQQNNFEVDGQKRTSYDIISNQIVFLETRKNSEFNSVSNYSSNSNTYAPSNNQQSITNNSEKSKKDYSELSKVISSENDLPF
ncbi:MAG: single-stranded DNA-binding protein [Acholeplasmatales bacterium]|jgi:single-strand DNA-binding protein|nr:single-stranded DNA-binding protein [Acholeplasmatales bacterium]